MRSKVEQLLVEPVSQAAANQRAGRCGRVSNGVCIRLYDEKDFAGRLRFTDPEILRIHPIPNINNRVGVKNSEKLALAS